jgi:hypothetical protein
MYLVRMKLVQSDIQRSRERIREQRLSKIHRSRIQELKRHQTTTKQADTEYFPCFIYSNL